MLQSDDRGGPLGASGRANPAAVGASLRSLRPLLFPPRERNACTSAMRATTPLPPGAGAAGLACRGRCVPRGHRRRGRLPCRPWRGPRQARHHLSAAGCGCDRWCDSAARAGRAGCCCAGAGEPDGWQRRSMGSIGGMPAAGGLGPALDIHLPVAWPLILLLWPSDLSRAGAIRTTPGRHTRAHLYRGAAAPPRAVRAGGCRRFHHTAAGPAARGPQGPL